MMDITRSSPRPQAANLRRQLFHTELSPLPTLPLPRRWASLPPMCHLPGLHSTGSSHPGQGTSPTLHLPLDQGHPTHDTYTLIISDASPIPVATNYTIHKTLTSTSVYTPSFAQVIDASNVTLATTQKPLKRLSLLN